MISIRHLEKSYGNVTPLKDVNAEIHQGDVISVIGPSGTGKSTLLRCINMLETPTAGQIIINGADMTDKNTDILKVRSKVGMVFQSFNLFSHKMVIENVMMAPMDILGVSKQEAFDEGVRYLKMVGLGEKLYSYPDELSGGQKQRVAIARCLAMKPEIILFDEPTSALDPNMVAEVQAVIHELAKQGLTMMVVTHDMAFSRDIANRIFYMDQGIVYEDGTPDQIFNNPQKERTKAFVKRLRTMEYKISSVDFDLYQLNGRIEEFCRKHYFTEKKIKNIELVVEELVENHIIRHSTDILVQIGYFEVDDVIELSFVYGGESFNPLEEADEDDISILLVRKMTSEAHYTFDTADTADSAGTSGTPNKLVLKMAGEHSEDQK